MRTNLEPFAMVPRDLIAAVSPRALQVWCCLHQWSDGGGGQTFPTIARIAGELDINRRAVERALAELVKSGRLIRDSGKAGGARNAYTLILTKRGATEKAQGAAKKSQGYAEKVAGNYKVVPRLTYQELPPNPPSGGGGDSKSWGAFWQLYPRKEKPERARSEWDKLAEADQQAAQHGVEILAAVYKAAPPERLRYTRHAYKWLAERGWEESPAAVEAHYNVPGLLADMRREALEKAAREKHRREWQEMQDNARRDRA